ncbi:MAG TPA: hypothetical protein EYQ83_10205 [Acidobacteria bacterium]|nr:hypothetical protein [Acidobacteriota bacterium]
MTQVRDGSRGSSAPRAGGTGGGEAAGVDSDSTVGDASSVGATTQPTPTNRARTSEGVRRWRRMATPDYRWVVGCLLEDAGKNRVEVFWLVSCPSTARRPTEPARQRSKKGATAMMDATTRAARTRGPSAFALVGALIALVAAACTIEVGPEETGVTAAPVVSTLPVADVQPSPAPEPYGDLRSDEQAVVDLFEDTSPSVVYISTLTRRVDVFGRTEIVPAASGTGFVWDDQGHIVTNYHVIQGADQARVVMHDQTGYLATWVGRTCWRASPSAIVTGFGWARTCMRSAIRSG